MYRLCSCLILSGYYGNQRLPLRRSLFTCDPPLPGQSAPSAAQQPLQLQAKPKKKAEAVQCVGNRCPECQAAFGSQEEVAQHFQEVRAAHGTVSDRTC